MRRASPWTFAAVAAVSLLAASASAQSAGEGRELYMNARFQEAVRAFESVLASASSGRADLVEAHRYLTALGVLLGDAEAAQRHARVAVALDPSVTAPEGAPPQVGQALDAARQELGGAARLSVGADGPVVRGEPVSVRAVLAPAPEGLAASLWLRCEAAGAEPAETSGPPPAVSVSITPGEDATEIDCASAARTESLADTFRVVETIPFAGDDPLGSVGEGATGGPPWLWIGVGGAAVAVAAVLIVVLATSGGGDPTINDAVVEGW